VTYVQPNYKTKKALADAIKAGDEITVFEPGFLADEVPANGRVYLEGPHAPEPHRWYAVGIMKDGKLVKIS
jgi:hypothetical protein